MAAVRFFDAGDGRRLAYRQVTATAGGKDLPGVVFLCGFHSDMTGTKAQFLEDWARRTGRACLRFDYTGHGQSSGAPEDGGIGDWAQDAMDILGALTEGPQILVGSSMGGWIALLIARRAPEKIAGLVTIAAAADFTEDSLLNRLDARQRRALAVNGRVAVPSEYSTEPYVITRRLIEQGREHLVLRDPLRLPFPTRFLQGTADPDVDLSVALRLLAHAEGPDIRLTLVKDADHRFNARDNLEHLTGVIAEITNVIKSYT